jgi:hypothetical protein
MSPRARFVGQLLGVGALIIAITAVAGAGPATIEPGHAAGPSVSQPGSAGSVRTDRSTLTNPVPAVLPIPDQRGPVAPGPGLYGGTLDNGSCNSAAMLAFFAQHPARARARAGVQGITTPEIPAFVASLTSVRLRANLAVTSHGYAEGRATDIPMVLPAGTAILVDKRGNPRSQCYCGNPLTPDSTVANFVSQCEKSLSAGWRRGQVDYPKQLTVTAAQSTTYLAAVDIRANPLPPSQVLPGPILNSAPVQVKCVLSARLVPPPDKSLDVANKDWLTREFTPTGVATWNWSVTGLTSGPHPLTLELQPAVAVDAGQLLQPNDNSPYLSSYLTTVQVNASLLKRVSEWWNSNWPAALGVLTALGAAVLAFLGWLQKLLELLRKLFRAKEPETTGTGPSTKP